MAWICRGVKSPPEPVSMAIGSEQRRCVLTAVIMMLGLSLRAAHLHAAGFGKGGDAPE